jgi:hypothetical protein
MNIHLAQVIPKDFSCVYEFRTRLKAQRYPQRITVVDEPSQADLIIFSECHQLPSDYRLRAITQSEVARAFQDRIAVYDERARPWCSLPGIYVNMPAKRFDRRWQVAGSYWHLEDHQERTEKEVGKPIKYLYSFMGSPTHRCRESIYSLTHRRSFVKRVDGFLFNDPSSQLFEERRKQFAEVMFQSSFVLCPRGHGPSSFRVYEALAAGRVPVIISDDWVQPTGPDWAGFSIRWPEAQISTLPVELERRENEAAAMGVRAREAFTEWFASDVALVKQIETLASLLEQSPRRDFPKSGVRDFGFYKGVLIDPARARLSIARRLRS